MLIGNPHHRQRRQQGFFPGADARSSHAGPRTSAEDLRDSWRPDEALRDAAGHGVEKPAAARPTGTGHPRWR